MMVVQFSMQLSNYRKGTYTWADYLFCVAEFMSTVYFISCIKA